MNNNDIYMALKEVPSEAKKEIKAGRLKGFTDINPMWRIKRLTEYFGPCGIGWWYDIVDKRLERDDCGGETAAFVDILLYYKHPETGEVSHGIPGFGGSLFCAQERNGPHTSDECFKMALTDAIGTAAKSLGLGAAVYFEKDRTKYNSGSGEQNCNETKQEEPEKKEHGANEAQKFECECCGAVLKPYIGADGKEVSIRKHEMGSRAKFRGHLYCVTCITSGRIQEGAR